MKKFALILIFITLIVTSLVSCKSKEPTSPISFKAIQTKQNVVLDKPQFIKASDGIDLAYYTKFPKSKPVAALIFLHGGGAWSGAGYQYVAKGLSEKYHTAVYLSDIRGHGNSGGPRGDTPSIKQVWNDLTLLIKTVRKDNPEIPLYLGGHSNPTPPAQIQKILLPKFAYGFSFCPLFQVVVYLLIQRRSI
jgi:acylglycerol lipase